MSRFDNRHRRAGDVNFEQFRGLEQEKDDTPTLGQNAIALVTTMNKRTVSKITDYTINLIGTNRTDRWLKEATLTTEHLLNDRCDYSLVLGLTNLLDNMRTLEIEAEGVLMKLPFKKPKYSAPKPVVFCVSPQFAAEQWQTFLVQLHVSKRYGAHLQLYIVSMVESYFKLIKEYEKLGLVSIEPWLTIKFPVTEGPYLEPNRNVELRNQAAAHTDCLLMYKEATSFVGILDMDDILIPSNANSYYEEFEREYAGSWLISALHYTKYDYRTIKIRELENQSISAIVKNSQRLPSTDAGKSFLRPERFNSTWSHYSRNVDGQPIYVVPNQERPFFMQLKQMSYSGIYHMKKMNFINSTEVPEGEVPVNPGDQVAKLISEKHLQEIDDDLKRTISSDAISKLSDSLPKEDFYMPIVFKCYNESFYHIRDTAWLYNDITCVNAFSCELPQREDLPCIHSDATYHSGPTMWPITFHYASDSYFSRDIGCYQ
uniref:Glycosyltransferase family 92 protein n=1 Tax=Caenorhabditis japonica TaxID=281687 RepID=A0A8R1DTT0_CAEJA